MKKVIAEYANKSKIFFYPGDIGLSIIHAMAYGLPVLIHSHLQKHCPEGNLFQRNKSGFNFCRNDFYDFSKQISNILRKEEKLYKYSKNNIEIIKDNLSTEKMAENFYKSIHD